ncbi:MAG: radical SAM protein [Prevotella sp.]|nr:radical SAM protein [Candidatus Equicola faecalis]
MDKAAFIGLSRLRMGTDGRGVTTLVAFRGCPLRCKYCLNPQSFIKDAEIVWKSSEEIVNILHKDELYFLATDGGVCFGGGEPLLKADFIKRILDAEANEWRVTVETSLNVPLENIKMVEPYIDEFIVDIKDMNNTIYQLYTGKSNVRVVQNLKWLLEMAHRSNDIICRIPLIPDYNTEDDRNASQMCLEALGVHRFDRFEYITNINKLKK